MVNENGAWTMGPWSGQRDVPQLKVIRNPGALRYSVADWRFTGYG